MEPTLMDKPVIHPPPGLPISALMTRDGDAPFDFPLSAEQEIISVLGNAPPTADAIEALSPPDPLADPGPDVVKPFLKMVGGKWRLREKLLAAFPEEFGDFHSPFGGSGADTFALAAAGRLKGKVFIGDASELVIMALRGVQEDVEAVIRHLETFENTPECFQMVRKRLNMRVGDRYEQAAQVIYLNKTAFNGLLRVNSKGEYNVGFAKYKNPSFRNPEVLRAASKTLNPKVVSIRHEDFWMVTKRAKAGDFVYMDPPYVDTYDGYTPEGFSDAEQVAVAQVFRVLDAKGVKVVVSNAEHPRVRELYEGAAEIRVISRFDAVSCKASTRGEAAELLIRNF